MKAIVSRPFAIQFTIFAMVQSGGLLSGVARSPPSATRNSYKVRFAGVDV